ncbi:class IV adenylate cyclase [Halospeciosus flavus]|uniref:Class IV adenylate cyclase n=1 Tax=Halospeciosus flavus TaxID=3032283 RepID=A0ABD5Z1Q6_9EURY|nr:class IV adenylate cyclase [Halospeciosus flavus]
MYEVEVKVPASHREVEERLVDAGANFVDEVVQRDTYYDAPHRDFAETDEALRVRRVSRPHEDGETESRITYKGPLVEAESKTRREIETGVDDGDDADAIFEALGFEAAATVEKRRETYTLDDYTVVLDDVVDVGTYVEVETEVEEDEVESAREGAYDVLRRLGLDPDEQVRTSYLGMLLAGDRE